jgi:anti-sigma factor RsiW
MNLHPDVVRDLLSLYLAGEASPGTRSLIEEQLAADPALREQARQASHAPSEPALGEQVSAPQGVEREALSRTRRALRLRSWLMGLAIFTTVSPFSFFADEHGTRVLLLEAPRFAGALLAAAAVLWIAFWRVSRRLQVTGL